ncbi:hypothetical protein VTN96DRAFT_9124 [Rasamsonia emersonii]
MPPITLDPSIIDQDLTGKTIIVTGGSNGIGAETVRVFYARGANVVIADLPSTESSATSLLSSLDDSSSRSLYVPANIVIWDDMKAVYSKTIERFGSVEIVVANAGIMESRPFFDMDNLDKEPSEAYKVIDINVKGTMNTLRLGVYHMRSNPFCFPDSSRGSIVLVSSTSGYFGGTGVVSYVSSKHAVTGLLRSSQSVAESTHIRINAVAPFFTPTHITAGFSEKWKEKALPANSVTDVAMAILQTALDTSLKGRCCMIAGQKMAEIEGPREAMIPSWIGGDAYQLMADAGKLFKELGGYPLPKSRE